MFFVGILILTALSIAGCAAFFSVYGLAQLFKGIWLYVAIMGTSLEVGKLVATSFLYRYWTSIHFTLKTYLLIGVAALMVLTSMGIFGLLSQGYQTDSLPLKQLEQQISLFDEEKIRSIERKKQIDTQIANLPADYSKSRIKLMDSFKSEQESVTARIAELDAKMLEMKTKIIQTEAHIGPITYIAKVLDSNPDDATKYLIYLIIFVFDPMAIALTLAVNIAIKKRQEELASNDLISEEEELVIEEPVIEEPVIEEPVIEEPVIEEPVIEEPVIEEPKISSNYSTHQVVPSNVTFTDYVAPVVNTNIEEPAEEATPAEEFAIIPPPPRRVRPYAGVGNTSSLEELLKQDQYYKNKIGQGEVLSPDERWSHRSVQHALHQAGYNIYI